MEKLNDYLNSLEVAEQTAFADSCKTSIGYLRKALSIKQPLNPKVCVRAERFTAKKVMRWDLRPDDWFEFWPELVGTKGAPELPQKVAVPA